MERPILSLLVLTLLLLGCTGQAPVAPPPQAQEPPVPSEPPAPALPTCQEHCMAQPHPQCQGSWDISGEYPDCVCGFICDEVPQEVPEEDPAPETPPMPEPELIQKSVSQMLEDELSSIRSSFYSSKSGNFQEVKYHWKRVQHDPVEGEVVVGFPNDVRFDGEYDPSILASGFYVFTEQDEGTVDCQGVAIFQAKSTLLDRYSASDPFSVVHFPAYVDKELDSCYIASMTYNKNEKGDWLITYRYMCLEVLDR